ncbi:hypothetical protein RI129_003408 [Pyrocoelia pectoralis]|uniref:PCNA-associated factor histone-like domain-containing protein n=1 Tax=Pyrocoelia pectoralis TaxID=417401 RepID=A0AAN7ZUG7_9COLE
MVRTAGSAIKTGGKNFKAAPSTSSARSRSPSSGPSDRAYNSHNTVCPRETPTWQKPITTFFRSTEKPKSSDTNTTQTSPKKSVDADEEVEEMEEDLQLEGGSSKAMEDNGTSITDGHNDCEMEENILTIVAKIRPREDDDNVKPKKKRRLNPEIYSKLEALETCR